MADEFKLPIPNDVRVVISNKQNGVLLDEDCCTCINLMLTNEGKIATSFLGSHNPYIVKQLEKAQRTYFRELKKTLMKDYKEYAEYPNFAAEEDEESPNIEFKSTPCGCGDHHECDEHCDCGCNDEKGKCNCDTSCDCGCQEEGFDGVCECDESCKCGCHDDEKPVKKTTKSKKSATKKKK